jgi:hypothetical protein
MELRCVKTVAAPSGWHGFSNTGSLPWTDHPSRKMRFVASVCVNASLCFCKVVCSPRRNASGILRCWPLKTMREVDDGALRGRAVLGPRRRAALSNKCRHWLLPSPPQHLGSNISSSKNSKDAHSRLLHGYAHLGCRYRQHLAIGMNHIGICDCQP